MSKQIDFPIYDETNAPEASRPLLTTAKERYGFNVNVLGGLAESPQALDLLIALAIKTISNYANHIMDTPLDDEMSAHAWQKPEPTHVS